MTKGDQIVTLLKKEPRISLAVVAERVGCHPAYVRTAMHRAGMFRKKHDPDVVYDTSRISEQRRQSREQMAEYADALARKYEQEAAACGRKQVRVVPEPQLSTLKAQHWRIIAKWIREYEMPITAGHRQNEGNG